MAKKTPINKRKVRFRPSEEVAASEVKCELLHFETTAKADVMQKVLEEKGFRAPSRSWSPRCKAFHITHGGKA